MIRFAGQLSKKRGAFAGLKILYFNSTSTPNIPSELFFSSGR